MKIAKIVVRRIHLPMREPFVTSFGSEEDKDAVIVEVHTTDGAVGYAEGVASLGPFYSEETNDTVLHLLDACLIPAVRDLEIRGAKDLMSVQSRFQPFKGNRMAKACLEMAIWDAYAREANISLHHLFQVSRSGTEPMRSEIPVGISIGIQKDTPALLRKVEGYLNQGFRRIKVKIKPGYDVEPIREIRKAFGDILLMADANSAYSLSDIHHLKELDEYGLMMMEQPLDHHDIIDHATLQSQIQTPVCLDESIHSAEDARKAIQLGACKVINLKVGRVGGFSEALALHDLCVEHHVDLWCGGMLETGIGRLHNIQLTALPGFTMPGDTAPSARYFEEDLIHPPVEFVRPGYLAVEDMPGVAGRVLPKRLEPCTVWSKTYTLSE